MRPSSSRSTTIAQLRSRLEEADDTLRALRNGEADALLVQTAKGESVFTLKGADHTYRTLVETMPVGASTLSTAGDVLYANARLSEMLGVQLPKLFGVKFEKFVAPAYGAAFAAATRKGAATTAALVQCEVDLMRSDGVRFPAALVLRPLPASEVAATTLMVNDISQLRRLQAEERMLDQLALSFSTADSVANALHALLNHVCVQLQWSDGNAWLPDPRAPDGLRHAAVSGSVGERHTPSAASISIEAAGAALSSRQLEWTTLREAPSAMAGTAPRATLAIPVVVRDQLLCVLTFVTADAGVEEDERCAHAIAVAARHLASIIERNEAEAHFRGAFDDAPFGSALISFGEDPGRIVRVNRALVDATGRTEAQLLGEHLQTVLYREDHADCTRQLKALRDGTAGTWRSEVRVLEGADSETWFLLSVSTVAGAHGVATRGIAQFVNIDAHKQREQSLQRAHSEARDASRLKSDFVANMSHEIRTPLNGVIGLAELLSNTELSGKQSEYVAAIRGSGRALLAVIGDILDFSKIESGSLTLDPEDFSPEGVLAEAIDVVAATASAKGLTMSTFVDSAVPVGVYADAGRVRQILINLLGNAVKFTAAGDVSARLDLIDDDPPRLRYDITDTGPGLEPGATPFEPFWQSDSGLTRRNGGTGLGLPIVKQLSELMGGAAGYDSTLGAGSHFWFTFPYENARPTATALVDETDGKGAAAMSTVPTIEAAMRDGGRVLLADDDETNRLYAVSVLEGYAWQVDLATNGREAVFKASKGRYDVILMDCQMPELDGYEAAREIRRLELGGRHTPIIALTAHATNTDRELCLAAGMDAYLSKPFDPSSLATVVRLALVREPQANHASLPPSASPADGETVLLLDASRLAQIPRHTGAQLAELFIRGARQHIVDLVAAEAIGDWPTAQKLAHTLKGSSATIGAMRMNRACHGLGAAVASGEADGIAARQAELETAFTLTAAALHDQHMS